MTGNLNGAAGAQILFAALISEEYRRRALEALKDRDFADPLQAALWRTLSQQEQLARIEVVGGVQ